MLRYWLIKGFNSGCLASLTLQTNPRLLSKNVLVPPEAIVDSPWMYWFQWHLIRPTHLSKKCATDVALQNDLSQAPPYVKWSHKISLPPAHYLYNIVPSINTKRSFIFPHCNGLHSGLLEGRFHSIPKELWLCPWGEGDINYGLCVAVLLFFLIEIYEKCGSLVLCQNSD